MQVPETRAAQVARYVAPGRGTNVLNWTNGWVIVGGGNLAGALTNAVLLTNSQVRVVAGGAISNLSLPPQQRHLQRHVHASGDAPLHQRQGCPGA